MIWRFEKEPDTPKFHNIEAPLRATWKPAAYTNNPTYKGN